jgi:hypothetical protein
MAHQCPKNWLINIDMYWSKSRKHIRHRCFRTVVIDPYFPLFSMAVSTHFLKTSSETWSWGLDNEICGEKYMARGGLSPWAIQSHAFVVRRMVSTCFNRHLVVWNDFWPKMETRNGFILEGKSPEPWRHWYPTSQSPATYLTHKLTSFKARDWHGFVSKFGHHSSLSGWKWWNIE